MSSTYLSIDVATKSLAIGVYRIGDTKVTSEELPEESMLDAIIEVVKLGVYDLSGNLTAKEVPIHDKAIALKAVLREYDFLFEEPRAPITVLIEYQMNANHMSNAVFNMLVYHFAGLAEVKTVFPSLKNSIYLHPDLKLSRFIGEAATNYSANKKHCKYNFYYFICLFGHRQLLRGIKSKNHDDIADTFMQCIAYHNKSKK